MSPVTLAELDPKTRAKVLQQIGETEGTTVEKETFTTLGEPATLTNDQLADVVIQGVKKLRHYLPYIAALKERFKSDPRDSHNRLKQPIKGCYSWTEFCDNQLDRTPQDIGQALASVKGEYAIEKVRLAENWLRSALNKGPAPKAFFSAPTGYISTNHDLEIGYGPKPALKPLLRAAKALKVTARKSGPSGGIFWHLPEHSQTAPIDTPSQALIDNAVKIVSQPDKQQSEAAAQRLQDACRAVDLNVDITPARESGKFHLTYRNISEAEIQQAIDAAKKRRQS